MDQTEVVETTFNVTPLQDRVLARRLEEKETAKGGIIIPDTTVKLLACKEAKK